MTDSDNSGFTHFKLQLQTGSHIRTAPPAHLATIPRRCGAAATDQLQAVLSMPPSHAHTQGLAHDH